MAKLGDVFALSAICKIDRQILTTTDPASDIGSLCFHGASAICFSLHSLNTKATVQKNLTNISVHPADLSSVFLREPSLPLSKALFKSKAVSDAAGEGCPRKKISGKQGYAKLP